ncbi:helix-turn-helix domain-containing protein [Amycolatopsis sp. NPDC059021]|uniref:helix-turn-helix domain-containing protein n=1 Tax=Amycolatopsis sp. NPDC059021 TaxID=3346704 RepID=UPI003671C1EB
MAATPTPPRNLLFETTDYDQAGQFLTDIHGSNFRMTGGTGSYLLRYTRSATGVFSVETLGTAQRGCEITITVEGLPLLTIGRPRTTTVDYRYAGADYRFGPSDLYLGSTSEDAPAVRLRWHDGGLQAATLPFPLLGQIAATAETRRPEPVRFTDLRPHDPGAAGLMGATLDYLADALRDRPRVMAEPLVASAAGRMLAAAALTAFPSTACTDPTIEDRHDAHPRTLRRAIAFIDDHAHEDISVADIAAAADVTIRALQYAFRRHRDTTPMGYLRQARLHQTRQELLTADPTTGVTVTEIAARWGFFHPGRFAHHYRTTYGCPPYRTLQRHSR